MASSLLPQVEFRAAVQRGPLNMPWHGPHRATRLGRFTVIQDLMCHSLELSGSERLDCRTAIRKSTVRIRPMPPLGVRLKLPPGKPGDRRM